jgi:hypothetical protein
MKHIKLFEELVNDETMRSLNLLSKDIKSVKAPESSRMNTIGKKRFSFPMEINKTYSNDLFDIVLDGVDFKNGEVFFDTQVGYDGILFDIKFAYDKDEVVHLLTFGKNELGIFKDQLGGDINQMYELVDEMVNDVLPLDFWEIINS